MDRRPTVIDKLREEHSGYFSAFAMIVDINSYESMQGGTLVAQFTRDVLSGAIKAVEAHGGDVVGIMGDAVLAILPDAESTALACFAIAKDLDDQCEYIANEQSSDPGSWDFAPGGAGLKIGIEYGEIEESTISSRFLGEQTILAGKPIVYAARICGAGAGNRCFLGPRAAEKLGYPLDGPFELPGKREGTSYTYYQFDLSEIWREGDIPPGGERHWG